MQGPSAAATAQMVNAIQLALDEHGAQTKNGSCVIEYLARDDSTGTGASWDPAAEVRNANQAAGDPEILAYLGPYNSGAAKLSMPILNQAGPLVMISPYNTYWGLTKKASAEPGEPAKYYPTGVRHYARVIPADDVQGVVGARQFNAQRIKTIYLLGDGTLYGKGVSEGFRMEASKLGLEVKGDAMLDSQAKDLNPLVAAIDSSGGEALYYGGIGTAQFGALVRALRAANWQGKIGGPDGLLVPDMLASAGDAANGMIATRPDLDVNVLAKENSATAKWMQAYRSKFGDTAVLKFQTAYAYEAMNVILAAFDKCAAIESFTRQCVRETVMATQNWNGILGERWSFDVNGDTTLTLVSLYQVVDGQWQSVGLAK